MPKVILQFLLWTRNQEDSLTEWGGGDGQQVSLQEDYTWGDGHLGSFSGTWVWGIQVVMIWKHLWSLGQSLELEIHIWLSPAFKSHRKARVWLDHLDSKSGRRNDEHRGWAQDAPQAFCTSVLLWTHPYLHIQGPLGKNIYLSANSKREQIFCYLIKHVHR